MKPTALFLLLLLATTAGRTWADTFGYTTPYRIARMSFPETGVITELPVREGQKVKEGEILARLDYQVLQRELNMAAEQLRIRQMRFERLGALRESGSVSVEEYERAKADLLIDEERVGRIQAQIDNRTLIAPFDGVVSEIKKEIAESVSASGTHVLTMVQLDKLLVEMHLRPEEASRFREGSTVPLTLDGNQTVQSRVDFISPVIDAASNTIRIRFSLPNPNGIHRSGLRCSLDSSTTSAATTAPRRPAAANPSPSPPTVGNGQDLDPLPSSRQRRSLSHPSGS